VRKQPQHRKNGRSLGDADSKDPANNFSLMFGHLSFKLSAEDVAYLDVPYKPKAVAGNLR